MIEIPGFQLGVDYSEYGEGELSIEDGKLVGRRAFRVFDYMRHRQFLVALAGGIQFNGTNVTQIPPLQFDAGVEIYCKRAGPARGIGVPARTANGDPTFLGGARIDASYGSLDHNPNQGNDEDENQPTPGPYVTESGSTSAQVVTRAKKKDDGTAAWKWSSDDADIEAENAPDLLSREVRRSYTLTRHNVAIYPKDTIRSLAGKVNGGEFPSKSSAGGFPAETLMFDGDDFSRDTLSDGTTKAWTIVLKFTENPNGWNKLYRPSSGNYEVVVNKTSGEKMFLTGDFMELLSAT